MGLSRYKLGNFVELLNIKCGIPDLTVLNVSGVNSDKEFFEPAKQVGGDTSNYKVVPPDYFACNLMHVGRDCVLPIALNYSGKDKIVSPAYTVFKICENAPIIREYFFILLKSAEKDRYFWFHTDSSVRDGMSWNDFCEMELDLPPLSVQRKYVAIYQAMLENQKSYERGLEDLKLTCEGYIDNLRNQRSMESIGNYIELVDSRNTDLTYGIDSVKGVSIDKKFIDTKADMKGVNLKPYYIVRPNEFAYVPVTSRNGEKISLAINDSNETYICSSSYIVFRSRDEELLLPQYLMLYFSRTEFNRYSRFHSWGSARETFDWSEMCDVEIPIPDLSVQKSIANIYKAYITRKEINENLKSQIKSLCPILIKGSLEEGQREAAI